MSGKPVVYKIKEWSKLKVPRNTEFTVNVVYDTLLFDDNTFRGAQKSLNDAFTNAVISPNDTGKRTFF